MSITIRRADTSDAPALMSFYNELSVASKRTFRPLGEQTALGECEKVVAGNFGPNADKYDLIALDGERIVGWGFLWGLKSGAPMFGLGVADAFHGLGLGSKLMDAVLEYARTSGLRAVELTVVQDNPKAWGMYERRGFVRQREFTGEDGLPYYALTLTLE